MHLDHLEDRFLTDHSCQEDLVALQGLEALFLEDLLYLEDLEVLFLEDLEDLDNL